MITEFFVNRNPLSANAPVLASKGNSRKGNAPLVTAGDKGVYRFWFHDIAPGVTTGAPIRLTDSVLILGARQAPGGDTNPYVLAGTFTEGGDSGDGYYYDTELDFGNDDLDGLFTGSVQQVKLILDIEIQNADNSERQTVQFTLFVRRQMVTGTPTTGPALPPLPLAPTANTLLGGSADGLSWVQRTAAQVLTFLSLDWLTGLSLDTDGTLAANSDTKIPSQKAVKTAIATEAAARSAEIAAAGVGMDVNKGDFDCSANPNYPAGTNGWGWRVSVAGKIGGAAGKIVDVDDWFVCMADNAGGTQAAVGASWAVQQGNLIEGTDYLNPAHITDLIGTTGGALFQPLEDQRLSTTDEVLFTRISVFDGDTMEMNSSVLLFNGDEKLNWAVNELIGDWTVTGDLVVGNNFTTQGFAYFDGESIWLGVSGVSDGDAYFANGACQIDGFGSVTFGSTGAYLDAGDGSFNGPVVFTNEIYGFDAGFVTFREGVTFDSPVEFDQVVSFAGAIANSFSGPSTWSILETGEAFFEGSVVFYDYALSYSGFAVTDGLDDIITLGNDGNIYMFGGLGAWGHAPPVSQPATPVLLSDVIAILQAYGLCA